MKIKAIMEPRAVCVDNTDFAEVVYSLQFAATSTVVGQLRQQGEEEAARLVEANLGLRMEAEVDHETVGEEKTTVLRSLKANGWKRSSELTLTFGQIGEHSFTKKDGTKGKSLKLYGVATVAVGEFEVELDYDFDAMTARAVAAAKNRVDKKPTVPTLGA